MISLIYFKLSTISGVALKISFLNYVSTGKGDV